MRVAPPCLSQQLLRRVVRVRKSLDQQGDIVAAGKGVTPGTQQNVDALTRKARGDVKKNKARRLGRLLESRVCRYALPVIDTHTGHCLRHSDAVIDQHLADIARHRGDAIEVGVELVDPLTRDLAFLPPP